VSGWDLLDDALGLVWSLLTNPKVLLVLIPVVCVVAYLAATR
jgi:hypothetical protein